MGLSDRFEKQKKTSKKETDAPVEQKAKEELTPKNKETKKVEKRSAYPSHVQADLDMLEDIECMVLNKIAYTPVWFEFSTNEQKKLIKNYLNARLELPENAVLQLSEDEKDAFVTKILASV